MLLLLFYQLIYPLWSMLEIHSFLLMNIIIMITMHIISLKQSFSHYKTPFSLFLLLYFIISYYIYLCLFHFSLSTFYITHILHTYTNLLFIYEYLFYFNISLSLIFLLFTYISHYNIKIISSIVSFFIS